MAAQGVITAARRDVNRLVATTRVPEFLVGLIFPFWREIVVPGMPNEIVIIAVILAICSFVRPRRQLKAMGWLLLVFAVMMVHVIAVSIIFGQPWVQRSFRIVLLFGLALVIAEGRLHWKSMIAGMVVGMVVINAPAFYLGLTPNRYPPFLTGIVGDKNVAGMYYAVLAMIGLCLYRSWVAKLVHCLVLFWLTWLTGSRTSIMAVVVGAGWYLMRTRVGLTGRLAYVGLAIWVMQTIEEQYARVGVFEDRQGTDWLRSQIDAATDVVAQNTSWYGRGLNTAWVSIQNFPKMAFHNSYLALWVEGGVVMVAAMTILVAFLGLGLVSRQRVITPDQLAAEAAIAALLVCAWKLGEVFFTAPCFILLGIAWYERLGMPQEEDIHRETG